MVLDAVGLVSGGVGLRGVGGQCQGLSGLSVCEDACTLARAVGAFGLSGRRVSGGVGCRVVSGCRVCCREEQPYFVVSGLHQGLTRTTTNQEGLQGPYEWCT